MSTDHPIPTAVDIAVVGGGMVGGTLAVALCHVLTAQGYTVALIDADPASAEGTQAHSDPRTTAMSFASRQILSALSCWPGDSSPIHQVHVSHRGYLGKVRLSAEELGVPAVGYVIDNGQYLQHLQQRIHHYAEQHDQAASTHSFTHPSTDPFTDASADPSTDKARLFHCQQCTVTGIEQQDDHAQLSVQQLSVTSQMTAKLVVAADGARSSLREWCHLTSRETDYEQVGIIANVTLDTPHQHIAYERFAANGPVALLPLGTHQASMVLTADNHHASHLLALSDDAFLAQLQQLFGRRLGRFIELGPRSSWPLYLVDSRVNCVGRVLFMGNAARTLHPVAGQGFNLAVRDMGSLIATLRHRSPTSHETHGSQETQASHDPGDASVLNAYADNRKKDQQHTIALTDALARIFRGANPAFSHLRSAGLLSLDRLPGARQTFGRAAMGVSAGLPDLPYPH